MLSRAHIEGWIAEIDAADRPAKCAKEYTLAQTALELYARLEAAEGAVAGLRKALEGIHWMAGSNDASVLPSIENRADLALSSSSTPDTPTAAEAEQARRMKTFIAEVVPMIPGRCKDCAFNQWSPNKPPKGQSGCSQPCRAFELIEEGAALAACERGER